MKQELLELLTGKYLDSEISPAEERLLQDELRHNDAALTLLNELRVLHERTQETVTNQLNRIDRSAADIFEAAWSQECRLPRRQTVRRFIGSSGRFAAGLAAGLIIALGVMMLTPLPDSGGSDTAAAPDATATVADTRVVQPVVEAVKPPSPGRITIQPRYAPVARDVEWYTFPDDNGDQILIEAYREAYQGKFKRPSLGDKEVMTANYNGDI